MEDTLAVGESFEILTRPELFGASDPRSTALLDSRMGEDTRRAYLLDQLGKRRLYSTHLESFRNQPHRYLGHLLGQHGT